MLEKTTTVKLQVALQWDFTLDQGASMPPAPHGFRRGSWRSFLFWLPFKQCRNHCMGRTAVKTLLVWCCLEGNCPTIPLAKGLGNKFTQWEYPIWALCIPTRWGGEGGPKCNLHFYMRTFSQETHKPTDICYANQTCNLTFFRRRIKALRVEQGNPKDVL